MRWICTLGLLSLLVLPVQAAIDPFEFDHPEQRQRYHSLIDELRCPTCQNQNIAESNAALANDLRQRVYTMVMENHPDSEIRNFMVQRYGDFVTYRPPVKPLTWLLWFGPFIALLIVTIALAIWVRQRNAEPPPKIDETDRQRLSQILAKHSGDS